MASFNTALGNYDVLFTVGNSSINSIANSSGFASLGGGMNPQTFNGGTYTSNATVNTVLVGPYTIATGNNYIITTGSRVVII